MYGDFVGEKVQVVFLHQIPDPVHLFLRIEITGRVVGIADQDGLRALVDEFLELLHLGQAETFLNGRRDGPDHSTGRNGEGHVVRIGRFRDDDLVARVQAAQESEQHSLTAAAGDDDLISPELDLVPDDDLISPELDLVPVVISYERLPQRAIPL